MLEKQHKILTESGFSTPLSKAAELTKTCLPETIMKKYNKNRVGSEAQYGPRLAGEILHDYLENSNEPLARAYREHVANEKEDVTRQLFLDIYPQTELAIDLKLFTNQPERIKEGEFIPGMLTRDGELHFSFIQNAPEKKRVVNPRNPRVYSGRYVNVSQQDDGSMYPNFNRPRYSENFSFKDLCREAAAELIVIAGLVGEE